MSRPAACRPLSRPVAPPFEGARDDHPLGHHRNRGGRRAGRRAAHRRRRDQRLGVDPRGHRRREGRGRGRGRGHRRGQQAPHADAAGDPPPDRRAGAAPGRRGAHGRTAGPGRGGRDAHVRPPGPARRVGHPAAARPGRAGGGVVVRRPAGADRVRSARRVRRPPDHRRGPRRRGHPGAEAARVRLRPRRHRPVLDPDHRLARGDGVGVRHRHRNGHRGQRARRQDRPVGAAAGRLAVLPPGLLRARSSPSTAAASPR